MKNISVKYIQGNDGKTRRLIWYQDQNTKILKCSCYAKDFQETDIELNNRCLTAEEIVEEIKNENTK